MTFRDRVGDFLKPVRTTAERILFTSRPAGLVIVFIVGAFIGLGAFTFVYAKGFSYLSSNPDGCVNCHAMNQVFDGWMRGDHRHVAVCNDCHLPHNFFWKWFVKAENGFYHSFVFTFFDVPINIRARERSREVVAGNCVRCHEGMAYFAVHGPDQRSRRLNCTSCHRGAGHGHHR
jgi:cytochrome c nitrite reductase small subunit